ncbi:MAG: malate dehydrogenase [Candidatus Sumerlaeia bacterium]
MLRRTKISIVGAGNVGATAAHWALTRELGDVVLIDVVEGMAAGKGLDMMQSTPVARIDAMIKGSEHYEETAGSDIVVVTAGLARKPGMSRDDLLQKNFSIIKAVTEQVVKYSPDSILIYVTNPLDVMTWVGWKVSGFPKNRVFGMAGVLDTARFRTFLSMEIGISVKDIQALVLGGHGDSMVPLPSYTTVAGIPITHFVKPERLNEIIQRTRQGGGEIVNLLKTGSAFYAPAAAVVEMIEAIVRDQKRLLPCAALCEGEFGLNGIYVGVPVILGKNGVEKIVEILLTSEEREALHKSAADVEANIRKLSL